MCRNLPAQQSRHGGTPLCVSVPRAKRAVNLMPEAEFSSILLEKSVPLSPSPFPSELTLPVNVFLPSSSTALTRESRGI
jgi:hypothetical protein